MFKELSKEKNWVTAVTEVIVDDIQIAQTLKTTSLVDINDLSKIEDCTLNKVNNEAVVSYAWLLQLNRKSYLDITPLILSKS